MKGIYFLSKLMPSEGEAHSWMQESMSRGGFKIISTPKSAKTYEELQTYTDLGNFIYNSRGGVIPVTIFSMYVNTIKCLNITIKTFIMDVGVNWKFRSIQAFFQMVIFSLLTDTTRCYNLIWETQKNYQIIFGLFFLLSLNLILTLIPFLSFLLLLQYVFQNYTKPNYLLWQRWTSHDT